MIQYVGVDVWHFTDWSHWSTFIKNKLNALKVVCCNEEQGVGSLDGLTLYEWEDIVKDILNHPGVLPTLLGINEELDDLIGQVVAKPVKKPRKKVSPS